MSFSRVQINSSAGTGGSPACTLTAASSAGNHLVCIAVAVSTAPTVPSSFNTATFNSNSAGPHLSLFYRENAPSSSSVTLGSTLSGDWVLYLAEYSGVATSGSLDVCDIANNPGNPGNIPTGTITTSVSNELLVAGICDSFGDSYAGITPANGFTLVTQQAKGSDIGSCYLENTVTVTGTYSTGMLNSDGGNGLIASFKPAGGGGSTTYSDTGSGTLTLTGSGTEVATYRRADTATLTLSGSSVKTVGVDHTGTLSLTGSSTWTSTFLRTTAAGNIDLQGFGQLIPARQSLGTISLYGSGNLSSISLSTAEGTLTLTGAGQTGRTVSVSSTGGNLFLIGYGLLPGALPSLGFLDLTGQGQETITRKGTTSGTLTLTGAGAVEVQTHPSLCACNLYQVASVGYLDLTGDSTVLPRNGPGILTLSGSGFPINRGDLWGQYLAVWLLQEEGTGFVGEYKDQTRKAHNGTGGTLDVSRTGNPGKCPVQVAGPSCEEAEAFSGVQEWIAVPDVGLNPTSPFTISCFINLSTFSGNQTLYSSRAGFFQISFLRSLWGSITGSSGTQYYVQGGTYLQRGTWQHVAMVWNPGVGLEVFVNGVLDGSTPVAESTLSLASQNSYIGRQPAAQGAFYGGDLFDLRVSWFARDAAWLRAEFLQYCGRLGMTTGTEQLVS